MKIYISYCILCMCFKEAAYCLEEVVLLDPLNHVTHTKLADLYFTLGETYAYLFDHLIAFLSW